MPDPAPQPSNPISLGEIVVVIIRLFAIVLGLQTILLLITTLTLVRNYTDTTTIIGLALCAVSAVCARGLWFFSPFFARCITRGQDSSIAATNVTLMDLYSFAFVLTGVYFAVSAFGPSLVWLYYALAQSTSYGYFFTPHQQTNFYTLFEYLVKLLLGLALIFKARSFAGRLIKHQNKAEPAGV